VLPLSSQSKRFELQLAQAPSEDKMSNFIVKREKSTYFFFDNSQAFVVCEVNQTKHVHHLVMRQEEEIIILQETPENVIYYFNYSDRKNRKIVKIGHAE